jgi:hypothetical protein
LTIAIFALATVALFGTIFGAWRYQRAHVYHPPGGTEAALFLWRYWGHGADRAPSISWIKKASYANYERGGQLVAGNWLPGQITIAHLPGWLFAETALPTEIYHEVVYRRTGQIHGEAQAYTDAWHVQVEAAREALRKWEQ